MKALADPIDTLNAGLARVRSQFQIGAAPGDELRVRLGMADPAHPPAKFERAPPPVASRG